MAIRSGSGASMAARSEPPSIQQGKRVGSIYVLELAKARKIVMEQEEKVMQDRKLKVKAEIQRRMKQHKEELKKENEKKLQHYADLKVKKDKKAQICIELKKLSKSKKAQLSKEAVEPLIQAPLVRSSVCKGIKALEAAQIMKKKMEKKETVRKAWLENSKLRIEERTKLRKQEEMKEKESKKVLLLLDEMKLSKQKKAQLNASVKLNKGKTVQHYDRVKLSEEKKVQLCDEVKLRKGKKVPLCDVKKLNKGKAIIQPKIEASPVGSSTFCVGESSSQTKAIERPKLSGKFSDHAKEMQPNISQMHCLEFGYYYAANFLETMRAFEAEEPFESNEDPLLDTILETFDAPQWVDLNRPDELVDDVAFFCLNDCHSESVIFS